LPKKITNRFSEEREQIIMDLLQKNGRVTVKEITAACGISSSTARLQLQQMNDKGMLTRTHGGAVRIDDLSSSKKLPNHENIIHLDKKFQIACEAAKTIEDGDFIALSSGTTTLTLASMLHDKKDLTVVTDSVAIAYELLCDPNIHLYICGGRIQHRNGACFGPAAEDFLTNLRVDKAYCGIDSIDLEYGVTSVDIAPRTERALCRSGKQCYILADSSKFCVKPFIEKIIDLNEIDHLISDSSLDQVFIDALKKLGIHVMIGHE
jgi:DeoR/GlpR family transcriptional regulator of sugar metabolism